MQSLGSHNHHKTRNRFILGLVFLVVWFVVFWNTLESLFHLARTDEGHSHILAIPFLAAYFIYVERKRIFRNGLTGPRVQNVLSAFFLVTGVLLFVLGAQFGDGLAPIDALSLSTASAVLLLICLALAFVPGINVSHSIFPGILLLLLIPIPTAVRTGLVAFLVKGSSTFTEMLFQLTGTTFYRDGTFFMLSGINIEIADECSGIRSSIGLFITLLMASHMFLKRWWSKTALMVMVVPMVLVKNAIRITTLTLLAVHVDTAFLTNSPLHRGGGIVFFAIALVLLLPMLVLLRKLEKRSQAPVKALVN